MNFVLPAGLQVRARVPASSANLGPGFDTLGIALGIYDDVSVTVAGPGLRISVSGEGAQGVPLDATHLVVRAINRGLSAAGVTVPGLDVECRNSIPHSRGLGSSASAVVGGLAAAAGLVRAAGVGTALTTDMLVQLASEFEGHPDNASASVLGSAVVSWSDVAGGHMHPALETDAPHEARYFARKLDLHPSIRAFVMIPQVESSTAVTRGLLPDAVARGDAVFNVSRAALAIVALTTDPGLLFAATEDRLHQEYRAPVMPATAELVRWLRDRDVPATVSGAGPTVLALTASPMPAGSQEMAAELGFALDEVEIAPGVVVH
jgi:homoserine kinase